MRAVQYILIACLLLPGVISADDSYLEARRLAAEGKIQPLERILKRIAEVQPGEVLEVELEQDDGRRIYEVEVLGHRGIVQKFKVDAVSGDIIERDVED